MITRYLLQHPRISLLILLTIVIAGVACFLVLPRMEDPVIRPRVAVVSTTLPGAHPKEIESTVTIPIEQCLSEFSEIKQIRSNVRSNISNTVIELKDQINNTDLVWAAIKSKLESISDNLPQHCRQPELKIFPLKAYSSIIALRSTNRSLAQGSGESTYENELALMRPLAADLKTRLLRIQATEKVDIFGDPGEEVTVVLEPETLATTGLSAASIAAQVQTSISGPGGSTESSNSRLLIDIAAEDDVASILGNTFVHYRLDQRPVPLSDIAVIKKQLVKPIDTRAIVGNQSSIVLGVMVENESRVDLWANKFDQVIDRFEREYHGQFEVVTLFSQVKYINQRMNNLTLNLFISGIAVILITLLLMGWRSMIVVSFSLPLSALLVMFGLRVFEIPIHQMSVTGLIVALGLLIDNSIVIVEEVRSRVFAGAEYISAITESVKHLRMPLFGSTLTTVLAFLPIAMMQGPSGEFVGSIAISVILAVTSSFLLSLTVIPVLVALLDIKRSGKGTLERGFNSNAIAIVYRTTLKFVIRQPLVGIACGVLLPLIGYLFAADLQRQFFPSTDRRQIQIEIELPSTASHDALVNSVNQVKRIVEQHPNVETQNWFLGHSAPTFYYNVIPRRMNSPTYAQAFVDLRGDESTATVVAQLQAAVNEQACNSRVVVQQLQQGPPFDAPVEIRISGNNLQKLKYLGHKVRNILAQTTHVVSTRCDQLDTNPMLKFHPDQSVLKDTRLTRRDISDFLYVSTSGADAGSVIDAGLDTPVRVRINFADRQVSDTLAALPLVHHSKEMPTAGTKSGTSAEPVSPKIGSFGRFELDSEGAAILRYDGTRTSEVQAYIDPRVLPSVVLEEFKFRLKNADFKLPDGYTIDFGGESEKRSQAVSGLVANAFILFSIMILALVVVLGSFRKTLTIGLVGGLAIGLGPFALFCFGYPFGFMAIVGTMGLVGVAINDSIVVIAALTANEKLPADQRKDTVDVVLGCTRHVIATTLTTMIGFLPLVLNGGKFWPPLAIVMSAGVGGATLLALYFVPALNSFMQQNKQTQPVSTN